MRGFDSCYLCNISNATKQYVYKKPKKNFKGRKISWQRSKFRPFLNKNLFFSFLSTNKKKFITFNKFNKKNIKNSLSKLPKITAVLSSKKHQPYFFKKYGSYYKNKKNYYFNFTKNLKNLKLTSTSFLSPNIFFHRQLLKNISLTTIVDLLKLYYLRQITTNTILNKLFFGKINKKKFFSNTRNMLKNTPIVKFINLSNNVVKTKNNNMGKTVNVFSKKHGFYNYHIFRTLQKSLTQTGYLRIFNRFVKKNYTSIFVKKHFLKKDNWLISRDTNLYNYIKTQKSLNSLQILKTIVNANKIQLLDNYLNQLTNKNLFSVFWGLNNKSKKKPFTLKTLIFKSFFYDITTNNNNYVFNIKPTFPSNFFPGRRLFNVNDYILIKLLQNPLLYKYFQLNTNVKNKHKFNNYLTTTKIFFESKLPSNHSSNLVPFTFSHRLKIKVVNFFSNQVFTANVILWYHTMLIRFIENCSGLKTSLLFNPFLENILTYLDIARCSTWTDRVFDFKRLIGPQIFIKESLKIFHISFRMKDPSFLSSWVREMLKRTSFWKYRVLLRYIKYIVKNLFSTIFEDLFFKGFKLKLKGKISVGGNSRTRTIFYRVGDTSHTTFNNKIAYDLNYIYTFTGLIGFQIWFFF